MKKILLLLFVMSLCIDSQAQTSVVYTINTTLDRHEISPYIYGINNGVYYPATFRRLGGNRLSAYNWENNFSNAGVDYINENDDYMPFILGLPSDEYLSPASCIVAFHDSSLAQHAQSAITLPMVGWVANDGSGVVDATELAPSSRWAEVIDTKGSAFSLTPDTTDHKVFVDEELNFILNKFGAAGTATGVKNYIMDNEPGLWCSQFPHMRSDCVTYNELFTKSIALSGTVKNMDSTARVFGPESFGFSEYWNLQAASDASDYSSDHWFIDSYLKTMKHASDSEGRRLLDVFSVHWYPEVDGVYDGDTSLAVAINRMQCTRTLWDSSYVEPSWITASGFTAELPILPHIIHSVNTFYPGTKFGITEYDYGAHDHISGGIAEVDALGTFGRLGLGYASIWNALSTYATRAFDIYRNYDGAGGTFGSTHVFASVHDTTTTIYASVDDASDNVLHAIVTNNSYTNTINGTFNIGSDVTYDSVDAYYFSSFDTLIHHVPVPSSSISGGSFIYSIPPLSVYHFVFRNSSLAASTIKQPMPDMTVSPNPATSTINISYTLPGTHGQVTITDISGKIVRKYEVQNASRLVISDLAAGSYFINLSSGSFRKTEKATIIR